MDNIDKVLILHVRFTKLGNTKKVELDTIDTKDADKSLLAMGKRLIDCKEFSDISSFDTITSSSVKRLCLPTKFTPGLHILPLGNVEKVHEILWGRTSDGIAGFDTPIEKLLTGARKERQELIDKFVLVYDKAVENSKQRLGHLFDPTNYKDKESVSKEFGIESKIVSFDAPQILKQTNPKLYKEMADKAKADIIVAVDEAKYLIQEELLATINRLKGYLTEEDGVVKKFYSSGLTNLTNILDDFSSINLSNDTRTEELVNKLKGVLSGVTTKDIKSNKELKAELHLVLDDTAKKLAASVKEAPVRGMKIL